MTARVLKQDQTYKSFKITLFIRTQTQSANFRGNPIHQATKRHDHNKIAPCGMIKVFELN